LVVNGADSRKILLMTFSRRTAAEMARRVERIARRVIGDNAGVMTDALWAGTFHGIGARLLRDYAGEIGLDPAFTIYDREDSADLMNLMRHELGFSKTENRFPAKGTCLAIYSRCVNAELPIEDVLATSFPWCAVWAAELKRLFALVDSVKEFHGIYTASFLSAFSNPPADFVATIDGQRVVPERDLQRYLLDDVPKRAQFLSLTLRQYPDAIVTSPDKVYLGRISGTPQSASAAPSMFTTKDLATLALGSASAQISLELDPALAEIGRESGYFATHDIVINSAAAHDQFEGLTGFAVSNTGVKQVAVTPGATVTLVAPGSSSEPAHVGIKTGDARDTSVLIQFDDGSGAVVAVLPGFVGTIAVEKSGVVSLNYTPSRESGHGSLDPRDQQRLEQLRANAAAAARLGAFRVDTPKEAARLADALRVLRGIDPTLGLYAAYAYEQAGLLDQIRSVAEIIRANLGMLLFDVAMLAGPEPPVTVARGGFIAPFCPMLSQGWNYLGATRSIIPAEAPGGEPPAPSVVDHV
jgi:hypothetical protein